MTAPAAPAGRVAPAFARGHYVRAVNLHLTPRRHAARLEAQLGVLAARFAPVTEADVLDFCVTGRWPHARPGVIVSLFNGYREHAEVAAPILDRVGLVGWFFVPTAFVDAPAGEQRAFAAGHALALGPDAPADGRVALSWDEVRALVGSHVIASHTRSHRALTADLAPGEIEAEISGSKLDLERQIDRPVRSFAWLYGGTLGADPRVHQALVQSGYELLFANHAIQRLQ